MSLYVIHVDLIQLFCRFQLNVQQTACCFELHVSGWVLGSFLPLMLRIWTVVIQTSKLPNWGIRNMGFHVLNIDMLLAVLNMKHEFSSVNNGL